MLPGLPANSCEGLFKLLEGSFCSGQIVWGNPSTESGSLKQGQARSSSRREACSTSTETLNRLLLDFRPRVVGDAADADSAKGRKSKGLVMAH